MKFLVHWVVELINVVAGETLSLLSTIYQCDGYLSSQGCGG